MLDTIAPEIIYMFTRDRRAKSVYTLMLHLRHFGNSRLILAIELLPWYLCRDTIIMNHMVTYKEKVLLHGNVPVTVHNMLFKLLQN